MCFVVGKVVVAGGQRVSVVPELTIFSIGWIFWPSALVSRKGAGKGPVGLERLDGNVVAGLRPHPTAGHHMTCECMRGALHAMPNIPLTPCLKA